MPMKVLFVGERGGKFEFSGSNMDFEALMENFDKITKWVDLEGEGDLHEEKTSEIKADGPPMMNAGEEIITVPDKFKPSYRRKIER